MQPRTQGSLSSQILSRAMASPQEEQVPALLILPSSVLPKQKQPNVLGSLHSDPTHRVEDYPRCNWMIILGPDQPV